MESQGYRCRRCNRVFNRTNRPSKDHLIPQSKGGRLTFRNVAALCGPCNSAKGARFEPWVIEAIEEAANRNFPKRRDHRSESVRIRTETRQDEPMPVAMNKGTAFPKAPAGVHRAVCIKVIDLGHQPGFEGQGLAHKVLIMWELSDELMEDGRPFAISEEYTLSLNEKANLRKKLDAWRGKPFNEDELKGFELANLLGKPCQLQVAHEVSKKGKEFAKVTSIMPLAKGMQVPEAINELVRYDITDSAIPDGLPEWIVNKINGSDEKGGAGHQASSAGNGSSISGDAGKPPF